MRCTWDLRTRQVVKTLRTFEFCQATGRGAGPPLILVNGLGASQRSWNRLVEELGPDVSTLRFDLPDLGDQVPTIRMHADAVAAIMDRAGIERGVLAGWSFGGLVAQEFARRHPDRLAGLALISSSTGAGSWPPTVWGAAEVAGLEVMRHVRSLPTGATHHMAHVAARSAAVMRWTSLPWLHTLDVPALVAHGWLDQIVPVANAFVLASSLPGAEVQLRPDGFHDLANHRPRWLAPRIRGLLERADHQLSA